MSESATNQLNSTARCLQMEDQKTFITAKKTTGN
jgi:hypothetical protein